MSHCILSLLHAMLITYLSCVVFFLSFSYFAWHCFMVLRKFFVALQQFFFAMHHISFLYAHTPIFSCATMYVSFFLPSVLLFSSALCDPSLICKPIHYFLCPEQYCFLALHHISYPAQHYIFFRALTHPIRPYLIPFLLLCFVLFSFLPYAFDFILAPRNAIFSFELRYIFFTFAQHDILFLVSLLPCAMLFTFFPLCLFIHCPAQFPFTSTTCGTHYLSLYLIYLLFLCPSSRAIVSRSVFFLYGHETCDSPVLYIAPLLVCPLHFRAYYCPYSSGIFFMSCALALLCIILAKYIFFLLLSPIISAEFTFFFVRCVLTHLH